MIKNDMVAAVARHQRAMAFAELYGRQPRNESELAAFAAALERERKQLAGAAALLEATKRSIAARRKREEEKVVRAIVNRANARRGR